MQLFEALNKEVDDLMIISIQVLRIHLLELEKVLVGAFSVITNLWMELFEALLLTPI